MERPKSLVEDIFNSAYLGEGYAQWRPAVHPHVIKLIAHRTGRVARALDIGCGTGLSTRALAPITQEAIGMEPYLNMLRWSRTIALDAAFLAGNAEAIPLRSRSMPLLTAAGSLNWADLSQFFPEARRVITNDGTLIVYDFGQGDDMAGSNALARWNAQFKQRYPSPPCRTIDPQTLSTNTPGFQLRESEEFAVPISVAPHFYLEYAMTETNVAAAIRNGIAKSEIRAWCEETLAPVFDGHPREVTFRGFIAYLSPTPA